MTGKRHKNEDVAADSESEEELSMSERHRQNYEAKKRVCEVSDAAAGFCAATWLCTDS